MTIKISKEHVNTDEYLGYTPNNALLKVCITMIMKKV
jgi:hypothetical protein